MSGLFNSDGILGFQAQEILAETLAGASDAAAVHGDRLTEDLCIERGQVHEKFAWMLRSHL